MNKTEKTKQEMKHATIAHTVTPKDLGIIAPEAKSVRFGFAVWVRVLMQNWRQGTVGCKTRSEVARSTKKPWKQKGTGRARAGTAGSPVWRGGGVAFGPQARVRKLKISKKQKSVVLHSMVYDYLNQGKVRMLDSAITSSKPSAAMAYGFLKQVGLEKQKITLFLSINDALTYASFINMPHVRILFFDQLNAVDLARNNYWVFFKKDVDMFKEMVSRWS